MKVQCQTCIGSTRQGLLWLSGDDWLECPDCQASGLVEVIEERFAPVERTISIPGVGTLAVPRHHPIVERLRA
jgi:hypothetical protein